jgi:hypothetical protein
MILKPIKIKLEVKVKNNISLWQAIKLRIAGTNYRMITNEIIRQLKITLEKDIN